MDPFAFATIIGLLATFQSSREGREAKKDLESFKQWLSENSYNNMIAIIESNQSLQQDLNYFMHQNHEQVMEQLSRLNSLMISVASRMQGLSSIASSFDSNGGLSEQAIDVLRQFVSSGSINMYHLANSMQKSEGDYMLDNSSQYVKYQEDRFITDDINSLVNFGLITRNFDSKNRASYKITRQAVSFIEKIDVNV